MAADSASVLWCSKRLFDNSAPPLTDRRREGLASHDCESIEQPQKRESRGDRVLHDSALGLLSNRISAAITGRTSHCPKSSSAAACSTTEIASTRDHRSGFDLSSKKQCSQQGTSRGRIRRAGCRKLCPRTSSPEELVSSAIDRNKSVTSSSLDKIVNGEASHTPAFGR